MVRSVWSRGGKLALILAVVLGIGGFGWDRFDQHGKGVFLAASGVMIVVLKVRSGLYMRELITTGTRADGVVVGAQASSDGDGGTRYYPRVRFATRDGQTTEFTSGLGYASEPAVGDPRLVRYRPDDPEQAEIDKPGPFIIFGALSLLLGWPLLWPEPSCTSRDQSRIWTSNSPW